MFWIELEKIMLLVKSHCMDQRTPFDSGQSAQSKQTDLNQNIFFLVNFLNVKEPFYLMVHKDDMTCRAP